MFLGAAKSGLLRALSLRPRDNWLTPVEIAEYLTVSEWYSKQLGSADAKSASWVVSHYKDKGFRDGLSPHPLFDEKWYQKCNKDVRDAEIPGLIHYLKFGFRENRSPHPLFNETRYRKMYGDVTKADYPGILHYVQHGFRENRSPHPLFDEQWYRTTVDFDRDLPGLVHYVEFGWRNHRAPHPAISDDFLQFLMSEQ